MDVGIASCKDSNRYMTPRGQREVSPICKRSPLCAYHEKDWLMDAMSCDRKKPVRDRHTDSFSTRLVDVDHIVVTDRHLVISLKIWFRCQITL